MQNFGIKIDLLKSKGAFVTNIVGRTATKRCLAIIIDESDLYIGEKGIYLDLVAFEMKEKKFDDTHLVKASMSKEVWDALTDEQRNGIPILGSMKPMISQMDVKTTSKPENVDDFPF